MALSDTRTTSMHTIAAQALFALKGGYHVSTLAATQVLDDTYPMICGFDPGGAGRNVDLDGTTESGSVIADPSIDGLIRIIVNRADMAEDLTVRDQHSTPVTIGTVSQNELGIFYHDGVTGWALVAIVSIALS